MSQYKPHILLLSLRFPGSSPVRFVRWIRLHSHRTSTIVLVEQDLDAYFVTLMDAGAVGILNAETPAATLEWSISQAISGESLYSEEHLVRAAEWRLAAGEKWERLSPRQKLILSLLGKGVKREEIAQRYEISLRTVNFHIGNITKKLKFKSLLEAVCWLHKYFPDDFEAITN